MRSLGVVRLSSHQRRTIWTGAIFGVGFMGAVDSIIFHQLLQWHNLYYDTIQFWRIFSDGVLQGFTAGMMFFGAMRLWGDRQRVSQILSGSVLWAGLILGAGAFQLVDGTINHKVLRLHQIREGVDNNLPYDIAWNGFAIVLLLIGLMILRATEAEEPAAGLSNTRNESEA